MTTRIEIDRDTAASLLTETWQNNRGSGIAVATSRTASMTLHDALIWSTKADTFAVETINGTSILTGHVAGNGWTSLYLNDRTPVANPWSAR